MRYSTIVEKDDKTLVEIITALEQFEQDRFIAGIQARHYTKYDIEQALDMVTSYQSRMKTAKSCMRVGAPNSKRAVPAIMKQAQNNVSMP